MWTLDMSPYPFSLLLFLGNEGVVISIGVGAAIGVGRSLGGVDVIESVDRSINGVFGVGGGVGSKLFRAPRVPACIQDANVLWRRLRGQVAERPPQPVPSRAIIPRRSDVWLAVQPGAGLRAWYRSKRDVHFFFNAPFLQHCFCSRVSSQHPAGF